MVTETYQRLHNIALFKGWTLMLIMLNGNSTQSVIGGELLINTAATRLSLCPLITIENTKRDS